LEVFSKFDYPFIYFLLQFLNGAQLARIVNPFIFPIMHFTLENLRGRLKSFLFVKRIQTLFLGPALQQDFILITH